MDATQTYMIEARGLTKRFDDFTALDAMELHVPRGCVYGLVGPNGAGKTTLIRQIAGVSYADAGETFVDGLRVWENTAVKERLVHIPDDLYFFPSADLAELMRYYAGIYPRFDTERFDKLKAAFPLDVKKRVSRFSKGMQKQAALWLALCCRPDVLLLDEPVDGLDPVARRTVWSLILQDVAEYRTTVLVSSHNLRELEGVCDHVGIMRAGKLVLERALADLQGGVTKLQIAFAEAAYDARTGAENAAYDASLGAENAAVDAAATATIAAPAAPAAIAGFEVMHATRNGRVAEYILRGGSEEVLRAVSALDPAPLLVEAIPLTLEEIFIYELGGMGYAEILI